jgi:beta-mannosidase
MRISLDGPDWQFKGFIGEDWRGRGAHQPNTRDRRGWMPASVPGCPLKDLWMQGQVPDPYFERNSLLVEWVPQRSWVYRRSFRVDPALPGPRARLHFEGIDYEAEFFLNGQLLGAHRGPYTPVDFEVGELLDFTGENILAVVIEPAPPEQPQIGRTSRVWTHKSRMTYWWDFCPRMVHTGIWDSVWLEMSGLARIEDVWVRPLLRDDFRHAQVSVEAALDSAGPARAALSLAIHASGQEVRRITRQLDLQTGSNRAVETIELDEPRLWWPNGSGEQPLYELEASLRVETGEGEGTLSDVRSTTFGVRRIELVPNEGGPEGARSYTLVVNGRKIYIKGWNWVPMDVMYGVPLPEKLERLLELARAAHVNLLRVWGGGLIEKQAFYDLCDRLGLLVWQEFILSSSGVDNIPSSSPKYIDLLAREAARIIPRRRSHPSLALWCGGNELMSGPEQPLDDDHPALAALKQAVERFDPGRSWLPTSPTGPVFSNSLANIARDPDALHDVHGPWEYQGVEEQPSLYNRGTSLLHSEFGVEGITNLKTLQATVAPEHLEPVSLDNPVWMHLGAWWVKRPAWDKAFGEIHDYETLQRATQYLQASGLGYAVEANRRRQYRNSGSLPWQFNEPYPMAACTSAVDYYARPKPVFFAVSAAYQPLHISASFESFALGGRERFRAGVWLSNSKEQPVEGILQARLYGVEGEIFTESRIAAQVPPNCSVQLGEIDLPVSALSGPMVLLDLRLLAAGGQAQAQSCYVFSLGRNLAPLLAVPPTELEVEAKRMDDECTLTVRNSGPAAALFAWLEDGRPLDAAGFLYLDQNYFCLLPGEARQIKGRWSGVEASARVIEASAWNARRQRLAC